MLTSFFSQLMLHSEGTLQQATAKTSYKKVEALNPIQDTGSFYLFIDLKTKKIRAFPVSSHLE